MMRVKELKQLLADMPDDLVVQIERTYPTYPKWQTTLEDLNADQLFFKARSSDATTLETPQG